MAQKLSKKELVTFKELLMDNSIQTDALAQLLIEKGIITKEDFFESGVREHAEQKQR